MPIPQPSDDPIPTTIEYLAKEDNKHKVLEQELFQIPLFIG
jgi:hypothetical protein